MRWISPKHGEQKYKRYFAYFPKRLKDGNVVWLEKYNVELTYISTTLDPDFHGWYVTNTFVIEKNYD